MNESGRGLGADVAPARRFFCKKCRRTHLKWEARCPSCNNHEGLVMVDAPALELPALSLPPSSPSSVPLPAPPPPITLLPADLPLEEPPPVVRPHLTIVRAPSPEPDLENPAEELRNVLPSAPIPISDVPEEDLPRDLTGLPPLDAVLGGGLVVGSAVVLSSEPGAGKCLGRGTPVLMFDGRVLPVEQILPGDRLMGPDGKVRTVITVNAGEGELFRIEPIKGESWICNADHVLTLVHSLTDEIVDVPLSRWLSDPPRSRMRAKAKLFSVGVDTFGGADVVKLPVDPYFLGLWFGDGTKEVTNGRLRSVSITKPDPEVLAACEEAARAWEMQVTTWDKKDGGCPTHAITNGFKGQANRLLIAMRDLLGADLKMPMIYTRAPRAQRLQFFAGLIDSDGDLDHHGCFSITQKREDWAREIWWMARSLGFCATISAKKGRCKRSDGSIYEGDYWRVTISGDLDEVPTRIPRKQAEPRQQPKDATRTGFAVEAIGPGEFFGFELDGDGRFLLGDFTVTHNSTLTMQALFGLGLRALYASGEESVAQCAARARRLGAATKKTLIVAETDVDVIIEHARRARAQIVVVDSIQTVVCSKHNGDPGSPGQVRGATSRLVQFAKSTNTTMWIIGHVTNDGALAGPKTLKHLVDVVLELEVGARFDGNERILRCGAKNRFGAANVVGHFEMGPGGLAAADGDGWDEEL